MPINKLKSAGIENNTIQGEDIATGGVDGNNVASNAVDTNKIVSESITTTQISNSAGITNSQLASSSFTINGVSVSLGGSVNITGSLDWQPIVVADGSTQVTLESKKGYFIDTNNGNIEAFLPTSPSLGDNVVIVDYGGNFGNSNLILNSGGKKIAGNLATGVGPNEFALNTTNRVYEFVFLDDTNGWLVKTATVIS